MSFINNNALDKDTSNNAPETIKANPEGTPSENSSNVSATESNYEKRYKDLQSYHDKTLNSKNQEIKLLKEKAEGSIPTDALDKEQLVNFANKNPELYKVIEQIARENQDKVSADLSERISKTELKTQEVQRKEVMAEVLESHPDAKSYQEGGENYDDFRAWALIQSDRIKTMITDLETTATDLSFVLTKYKLDSGIGDTPKKRKKQAQSEAAEAVTGNSAPVEASGEPDIWTETKINSLSDEEFNKYSKSINKASKEGRVILDKSLGR